MPDPVLLRLVSPDGKGAGPMSTMTPCSRSDGLSRAATSLDTPPDLSESLAGRLLYFVRHGESAWNLERRIQGQTPWPALTDLGYVQARRAACQLAHTRATVLLSSDAVRARQTAHVIAAALGLSVILTPLLREQHWGSLQGQTSDEAWSLAAALGDDVPFPGGESRREVRARVARLLRTEALTDAAGSVVLVTHGDTVTQAVALLDATGRTFLSPQNGSVTCLRISNGGR